MPVVKDANRLALGAAQLGMDYGIANHTGKPGKGEAFRLLERLWNAGLRWYDTAPAYGESEIVLGAFLAGRSDAHEAMVVSKLPVDFSSSNVQPLKKALAQSLERLQISSLAGLMLHREEQLDDWDELRPLMDALLEAGLVRDFGVSVYSPKAALNALDVAELGMIQVPANILDHRFRRQHFFDAAARAGKRVFIRSVFLQGLLFATDEDFARRQERIRYLDRDRARLWIGRVRELAERFSMPVHSLALAYVREAFPEARVLIGVETVEQAERNLTAWRSPLPVGALEEVERAFSSVEDEIVHPPYWRRGSLNC